jgi:hypothetical protein
LKVSYFKRTGKEVANVTIKRIKIKNAHAQQIMELLEKLKWRYAAKAMNGKKIYREIE